MSIEPFDASMLGMFKSLYELYINGVETWQSIFFSKLENRSVFQQDLAYTIGSKTQI